MIRRALAPLAAVLVLAAGCADMQKLIPDSSKSSTASPQTTEASLRARAVEQLALGQKQFEAGDLESATKNFNASLEHGMLPKVDQSTARKHLAMINCVSNREAQCRDEFRKAFEIYPDFALTQAEDGHPIWGPVYRSVRSQLIAEREAASAASRPRILLSKSEQMLSDGMVKYDAGDYVEAQKLYEASLKEGLRDKADQVRAMKHLAFCLCLQDKYTACRNEFVKIYDIAPDFDLTPAEAGHPNWSKTFASAKAQGRKLAAEKAAREKAEKDKAERAAQKPATAPPTAGATPPKKN